MNMNCRKASLSAVMRKTIWIMMLVLLNAVLNGGELRLALYKNGYCICTHK